MHVTELIRKKRDTAELQPAEIEFLINGYTAGQIPDYQMSAWLMAVVLRGMTRAELAALTSAMLHSGEVLDLSELAGPKVDKHSTGGVGDKTSLIIAPIVAAAGVFVPMVSGRGLGHTGGTLDKLESITGFNVNLSAADFRRVLSTCGCVLVGQTAEIAPADKKIYALRDVTGTVESPYLICASIMSKKMAEGIDALVLDVKTGNGAFMKSEQDAAFLAELMVETGERLGKRVVALLTDMDQPLGRAVGNSLEVAECLEIMEGNGPADLRELCLVLAAWMLASWFYFTECTWRVVIHDDGTLPKEAAARLRGMFPEVRVITRKEADAEMGRVLNAFPLCSEYREMHPLALKVFDIPHFAKCSHFLIFDSDLLFFSGSG